MSLQMPQAPQTPALSEQIVFSQTFEALARAVSPDLSELAKAKFRAAGIDYDRPLQTAYTYDVWMKAMVVGATLLSPDAPHEQQYYNVGLRLVTSYGETVIGRALLALLRLIGPKRTLERMTRNLRSANSFTTATVEMLPDGQATVTVWPVFEPGFFRGLFTGALTAAGGKDVSIETLSIVERKAVYAISWH